MWPLQKVARCFDKVQELGIRFLRYDPPIHRTFVGPEKYDWSFANQTFKELHRRRIMPITDQIDLDIALRKNNGTVDPLGLFDLNREIRPVGEAYKQLIVDWSAVLPTQSVCLTVPLDFPNGRQKRRQLGGKNSLKIKTSLWRNIRH
jgi:hypothetical protein